MKKTLLVIAMSVTATSANSAPISSVGVFDVYDPSGELIASDTNITGIIDQDAGWWNITSNTPFFGQTWITHSGTLYTQGSYTIDTIQGGVLTFTVGEGQIGGHTLWGWGATVDVDVVNVWDINADGSLSYAMVPDMVDGAFPGYEFAFELTSPGLVSSVPIPPAIWLFSSGFIGLIGLARRKITN